MRLSEKKIAPRLAEGRKGYRPCAGRLRIERRRRGRSAHKNLDNLVKELKIPLSLKILGYPDGRPGPSSRLEAAYGSKAPGNTIPWN
jgi:hypothetical protein